MRKGYEGLKVAVAMLVVGFALIVGIRLITG